MNYSDYENEIQNQKTLLMQELRPIINNLMENQTIENPQEVLNVAHAQAVKLFTIMERSLDECTIDNQDLITRKIEDCINYCETILYHWKMITAFCSSFNLQQPKPSTNAYSTIQSVIKASNSRKAKEIEESFQSLGLPTYGFLYRKKHSLWKRPAFSTQQKIGSVIGLIFLISGLILSFTFPILTGTQYWYIRIIGAIGAAIVLYYFVPGYIKVNFSISKRITISALGGLAIFIILYLINPASPPNMP
ncbi:Hypothetical protein LUCI_0797 [Lucifera butyrica]|uniref:Uncharacterized protein n=1 Tax=Lucifera butyrica TaxID=1351585 RepID=A0A498R413_9FIRM|nr:hypothetical protein [Lucifera butyrica]VBB05587.1 Hypothetical protein LUCI_0797 [Lucifera butyrica]